MSMLAAAVEPSECEVHPAAGTAVPPPIDPTIPATTEESEPVQSSTPGDTSYNHANTSVQHEAEAALTDQVPSPGQLQRFDTFCHQQLSATVSDNWKAEEVEKRRAVLQHTINSHRTTRPSILQPYWSARTGLLTKKSDLDFPIQCPQDLLDNVDPRRCLEEIKEILGNLQGVSKVELLTQALFPKLSCLYEGAEVDLTCWNGGAVFTAEVLAQCNELQPTFGQALRLLKLWAKKRRFSNTQGDMTLSSHTLGLMLKKLMENDGYLPVFLYNAPNMHTKPKLFFQWDRQLQRVITVTLQIDPRIDQHRSQAEHTILDFVLYRFFHVYGGQGFDYETQAISPWYRGFIPKSIVKEAWSRYRF